MEKRCPTLGSSHGFCKGNCVRAWAIACSPGQKTKGISGGQRITKCDGNRPRGMIGQHQSTPTILEVDGQRTFCKLRLSWWKLCVNSRDPSPVYLAIYEAFRNQEDPMDPARSELSRLQHWSTHANSKRDCFSRDRNLFSVKRSSASSTFCDVDSNNACVFLFGER